MRDRLECIDETYQNNKKQTFANRESIPFNRNDIGWLIQEVEKLRMHERSLEKAIEEIVLTIKRFDEELAYDCEKIVHYWAQS